MALTVRLKHSTKRKDLLKALKDGELSSKCLFKMPFNCGEQARLKTAQKRERDGFGAIVKIQISGKGVLYRERHRKDGGSREKAAVGR